MLTEEPAFNEPLELKASVPLLMVVAPLYVLALMRVSVPAPNLVKPPSVPLPECSKGVFLSPYPTLTLLLPVSRIAPPSLTLRLRAPLNGNVVEAVNW